MSPEDRRSQCACQPPRRIAQHPAVGDRQGHRGTSQPGLGKHGCDLPRILPFVRRPVRHGPVENRVHCRALALVVCWGPTIHPLVPLVPLGRRRERLRVRYCRPNVAARPFPHAWVMHVRCSSWGVEHRFRQLMPNRPHPAGIPMPARLHVRCSRRREDHSKWIRRTRTAARSVLHAVRCHRGREQRPPPHFQRCDERYSRCPRRRSLFDFWPMSRVRFPRRRQFARHRIR